jgi:hypothetical protein
MAPAATVTKDVVGQAFELGAQRLHRSRAADRLELRLHLRAQAGVGVAQALGVERALQRDEQFGQRDGFFDEVVGAQAGGLDRRLHRAVARHHDDRAIQRAGRGPFAQQGDAVGAGHPDVEQDGVEMLDRACRLRRRDVLRDGYAISLVFEDVANPGPDVGFVIDHQDVSGRHESRKRNEGPTV